VVPAGKADGVSRTVLYETHVKLGAKIVPFGGWDMPLHYGSIIAEHVTVRTRAGAFDVSHMGRLWFSGPNAGKLLQKILTRDVKGVDPGRSAYTLICNEKGGVIDDAIVTKFGRKFFLVVNASNRSKVHGWIQKNAGGLAVKIDDQTVQTAMIAVQGPDSVAIIKRVLNLDLLAQKYYSGVEASYQGEACYVFRSGYTGEEGCEVVLPAKRAESFWKEITNSSATPHAVPAGLGARDSLRLEAGMPLYGHEYTEQTDGISAGMEWVIGLETDFIGRDALKKIKEAGPKKKLVGLELTGRRQARQGFAVFAGEKPIGEVTSGTLSPTLEKSIAMAYIEAASAVPGTAVQVAVGEHRVDAVVVKPPFYKRKKA
jgi:aminomethyltransferase